MRHGAVADDFTGATDLAGNWAARGLKVSVALGLPRPGDALFEDEDAVVVALKSRTAPVADAVSASAAAARQLAAEGAAQLYFKYCSTFDSTPRGNIGPVADALLSLTGASRAVVVPSFPDTGRTVYLGHLFVDGQLLSDSPMRDHPLTPMTDANLQRLLQPQTQHPVGLVPLGVVRQGAAAVMSALAECERRGQRLVVVDAIDDDDLVTVAAATRSDRLVSGGSGLALGLRGAQDRRVVVERLPGRDVVLAGSASVATRTQVMRAREVLPHRHLDLGRYLRDPSGEVDELVAWAREEWGRRPGTPVMVYSVASGEDVAAARRLSPTASADVERFFSELAPALSAAGAAQFLIAGGETSGAVVGGLGVRRLAVGQALSPGVSWLRGRGQDGQECNLVLKSGNFGTEDLFVSAWDRLG